MGNQTHYLPNTRKAHQLLPHKGGYMYYRHRITGVMKVKTDTIASITESLILLVIMYVDTFKTDVIIFY